jgi:hypothetical protein
LKTLCRLGGASLLVLFLVLPALPDQRRTSISSTRSFTIDGKKFLREKTAGDDLSLIRGELLRHGMNVPPLGDARPANPLFSDSLREAAGATSVKTVPLPPGLRAEHALKAESDSGVVDLAFGSMDTRGTQIRHRMSSSGWECIAPSPGQAALAIFHKGREATIVLLEEKEGKFLLIRRLE